MELAADALEAAGAERKSPFAYRELLSMHLAEVEFRGQECQRIQYSVLTAFAVHGGLEPDLLYEVTYWIEQYVTRIDRFQVGTPRWSVCDRGSSFRSVLPGSLSRVGCGL